MRRGKIHPPRVRSGFPSVPLCCRWRWLRRRARIRQGGEIGQQKQRQVRLQARACGPGPSPAHACAAELPPRPLVGFGRVREAVAKHTPCRAASAGPITSAIACARSANIQRKLRRGRDAADACLRPRVQQQPRRMPSPSAVPPGWRVVTTAKPAASSRPASRRSWVVLPEPSSPSNVIKIPRLPSRFHSASLAQQPTCAPPCFPIGRPRAQRHAQRPFIAFVQLRPVAMLLDMFVASESKAASPCRCPAP